MLDFCLGSSLEFIITIGTYNDLDVLLVNEITSRKNVLMKLLTQLDTNSTFWGKTDRFANFFAFMERIWNQP